MVRMVWILALSALLFFAGAGAIAAAAGAHGASGLLDYFWPGETRIVILFCAVAIVASLGEHLLRAPREGWGKLRLVPWIVLGVAMIERASRIVISFIVARRLGTGLDLVEASLAPEHFYIGLILATCAIVTVASRQGTAPLQAN